MNDLVLPVKIIEDKVIKFEPNTLLIRVIGNNILAPHLNIYYEISENLGQLPEGFSSKDLSERGNVTLPKAVLSNINNEDGSINLEAANMLLAAMSKGKLEIDTAKLLNANTDATN